MSICLNAVFQKIQAPVKRHAIKKRKEKRKPHRNSDKDTAILFHAAVSVQTSGDGQLK